MNHVSTSDGQSGLGIFPDTEQTFVRMIPGGSTGGGSPA